jgi:hypothetical protein
METYTVWVTFNEKRIHLENVTGDGIMTEVFRARWFMLEDGTRWEFPTDNCSFEFSPDRERMRIATAQAQMSTPVLVSGAVNI